MRNEEISKRFDKIEERQSEFRETIDNVLVNQGEGMKQLNEIHTFLAGTEYDEGGLVADVKIIKKNITRLNKNTEFSQWVQKNPTWSIIISAIVIALIAGALHVTGLLDIIKLIL